MAETIIQSELNAIVLEIVVPAGADVEEDDTIIVLEAMKMEQIVTAPRSGTVVSVHVEPGQMVSEGDPLATIAW
jgi:biotin carboxyl carrier protein